MLAARMFGTTAHMRDPCEIERLKALCSFSLGRERNPLSANGGRARAVGGATLRAWSPGRPGFRLFMAPAVSPVAAISAIANRVEWSYIAGIRDFACLVAAPRGPSPVTRQIRICDPCEWFGRARTRLRV